MRRGLRSLCVLLVLWGLCGLGDVARALTVFYVDPDFVGTETGDPQSPWTRLHSEAWVVIDDALVVGDVIVYFSARQAEAELNQQTTSPVEILRTDGSTNRLILDGRSFYNSDDAAPDWQPASGLHRFEITARYPMTTGPEKRDYVTISGFRIIAGDDGVGGQIIYYWGGDHVIIEQCELMHHPNAGHGAGLQFGYAHHQGENGNGGCTDLVIRDNVISDTFGECIYVGGSEDTGLPAHTGVVVARNITFRCGVLGGEGDCIDIKDGNTDVTIYGNHCYDNADGPNVNGITASSPITAEHNVIHGTPGKGITFGTFWGRGYSGVRIAYNLLFDNAKDGIYAGTDTLSRPISDVIILHNTVVGNGGNGLVMGSGEAGAITGVQVVDNLFFDNDGDGLGGWGDLGGCVAQHNDSFGNQADFAGPFSTCDATGQNLSQAPTLADSNDPAGPDGRYFTNDDGLKPLPTSPLCGAGLTGEDLGALLCGEVNELDGGVGYPDAAPPPGGGDGGGGCGCAASPTGPSVLLFVGFLLAIGLRRHRRG
jgi:MYXO-CTERM domain-containing protein